MLEDSINFVEAINLAHLHGLEKNKNSLILGLGVNYPNGADGTTKSLAAKYPSRVLDVPVSEAAFTGMSVGMATMGLNPIVHHGRIEFALLAMDSILTQASKWNFMFGGDYPCSLGLRINLGRQWGNGPQHTAAYTPLFINTPGIDVLWPSNPQEAYEFSLYLHFCKNPTISLEHRYLFQTTQSFQKKPSSEVNKIQTTAIYGTKSDLVLITYGDGLVEALKLKEFLKTNSINLQVICITAVIKERRINQKILNIISNAKNLLVLDTSNYEFGFMQGLIGSIMEKIESRPKILVFSPPFQPCPTSPKLVKNFYPFAPTIVNKLIKALNLKIPSMRPYNFDELNLPARFDFSKFHSRKIYEVIS